MDSLSRSGACFEVGFRPFFLVAALFGLLTIAIVMLGYALARGLTNEDDCVVESITQKLSEEPRFVTGM